MQRQIDLAAKIEPFDTFWEGPDNIENGYSKFYKFYKSNYLKYIPSNHDIKVLILSCGPGYFVEMLNKNGYKNVLGIDSDSEKIAHAQKRGLNCQTERAFDYLLNSNEIFDVIIAEQEINHLTKSEFLQFLDICKNRLVNGGTLIVHSLNGANPITGAEALAQNFDHYFTFTEYSLRQSLKFAGFTNIEVFPLNLYVFWTNPFNYIALLIEKITSVIFRSYFVLYGKSNKIFSKKIAAVCNK